MFIINPIKKEEATGELKLFYTTIEKALGFIPPHFELFATIDFQGMKEFYAYNQYMATHKKIDKKLLPFLRLYIANKECRSYCSHFNDEILKSMGINQTILDDIGNEIKNIPCEETQLTLLLKVIKALYDSNVFSKKDLEELYTMGYNDKDFFDLLNYASNFSSKSKMIEAYLK